MIENIDLLKLNPKTLSKIKSDFDYDLLLNLACNYDNINNVIDLFNRFNIKDIDDMFIYEYNIFLREPLNIYNSLLKYGINDAIELINEDFTFINNII